ncbi:MAG: hypothetical protein WD944_06535 [Steroidobacteraceae bacterium]
MNASMTPAEQLILRLEADELDQCDNALQSAIMACALVIESADHGLGEEMDKSAKWLEGLKDEISKARIAAHP